MRRSVIWILVVGLLGLGVLCLAPTACAQVAQGGDVCNLCTGAAATPEINAGAAAGALTIVGGALALLGERLRRK